ncbi:hypothetical protein HJA95_05685 [Rhizobium binae]|uniref:hypothetical protein n=1 Tax=Rhizobium binae TaxID=1138190 RepID=UPI001C82EFB5|nr:hypothetical protein [Rhizobium binae]MBX4949098.1 hypothetical protein [Rhizobium binae]
MQLELRAWSWRCRDVLAHSASFHSAEKIAPSIPRIKHLVREKSVLTQQVEKMRQLGLNRFGEEADRADGGSGRDQSFEVNGKIAASANIGSNRHEIFRNTSLSRVRIS